MRSQMLMRPTYLLFPFRNPACYRSAEHRRFTGRGKARWFSLLQYVFIAICLLPICFSSCFSAVKLWQTLWSCVAHIHSCERVSGRICVCMHAIDFQAATEIQDTFSACACAHTKKTGNIPIQSRNKKTPYSPSESLTTCSFSVATSSKFHWLSFLPS